jgi:hypothetical protein
MTVGGPAGSVIARIYGSLLVLYPRGFRDAYGPDMVQLFEDQCRDEPTWRVCARSFLDLAITVPAQHLEFHMHLSPASVVSTIYLTIAFAGVAVAAVGGTNRMSLVMGLVIAVGAGFVGILARRGAAPTGRGSVRARWWKFLVAGPVLIGAVILAAGLGVEAWFLGIATVLMAIALFMTGLVLAVARLAERRSGLPTG